jgi:hypothetical protein
MALIGSTLSEGYKHKGFLNGVNDTLYHFIFNRDEEKEC